jgi:hypothetical protein
MCTVTIVPFGNGYRIGCNRDERNGRPQALSPACHPAGHRVAIYPVDPQGGGTWIAVNDAGLASCLLNRTDTAGDARRKAALSRGAIIPPLLRFSTVDEAIAAALAIEPEWFGKFHLVLVQGGIICLVTSNGRNLAAERFALDRPRVFTSSSLGDALVQAPRSRLFDTMSGGCGSLLDAQRRFHDHQWADRPEISVRMRRPDAGTVSRSFISVAEGRIDFSYEPLDRAVGAAA